MHPRSFASPARTHDTNRFKKKVEKDEEYKATVKGLGPIVEDCVKQARGRIREGGRGYHMALPGTPPPPGGGVSASTRSRMFPLRLQRLPV